MRQPAKEPMRRLLDRPPGGGTLEDRAAALLRASLATRAPDARDLARIEVSLRARASRRHPSQAVVRLGLALVCLLAGAATGKAYEAARRAGWLAPLLAAPPVSRDREAARPAKRRANAKAAPVMAAPMDEPAAGTFSASPSAAPVAARTVGGMAEDEVPWAAPATAGPHPAVRTALLGGEPRDGLVPAGLGRAARVALVEGRGGPALPLPARQRTDGRLAAPPTATPLAIARSAEAGVPPAPLPPAAAPGPAAPMPAPPALAASTTAPTSRAAALEEARGLDRAIAYLRRDHDAAAALAELDAYLERYPHAVLRHEASLARIDALLMLRRNEQALHALETVTFDQGRRATELLVVRAELRAQHDCRRAEQDFTAALARSPDAVLLERILHGRGTCRATLDDAAGASADARRYLERFPDSLRAGWARRWQSSRPR